MHWSECLFRIYCESLFSPVFAEIVAYNIFKNIVHPIFDDCLLMYKLLSFLFLLYFLCLSFPTTW